MLEDGYHDVPPGHTASVVTHLEMCSKSALRAEAVLDLMLERVERPTVAWYRGLFKAVGADYLWFGRLQQPEEALERIITDPLVHVYAVKAGDEDAGLLELDFRVEGECELAYFGVAPGYVGGGTGRWMMNRAIEFAWNEPISRFHVHTCTLDHPSALAFYIRSGFVPFRRQIEIARDPRLIGLYDRDVAPQIPAI